MPGEFGDDRTRFTSPHSRKNYAGTSLITRASGRSHIVLARRARNRRLSNALQRWAFCSLTPSPGARHYHNQLRGRGKPTARRYASSPTAGPASSTPASSAGQLHDEAAARQHLQAAA